MDYTGSMGDSAVGSGLPSVPLPIPPVPKASSHPNPGIGLIQAKASPPTGEPQGSAGVLPGFVGGRTRSPGPGQRSGAAPADASPPAGSNPSDRKLLLASLAGMRQLQCAVAEMAGKDRNDSNSPTHPETVKPGVTSFPVLPEPQSDEGYLLYQDWLVVVSGLVGDVSDSAAEWWSRVLTAVDQAYKVWVSSSPIDRLRVEPVVSEDLLQEKWARELARVQHVDGSTPNAYQVRCHCLQR